MAEKRGRGRPRKSEVVAKSKGGRGKVGRPKGDAAIMNEYKARMLSSPKSKLILQKVLDVALEDGHPNQSACMKMVVDRILPHSYFEKDKLSGGRSAVEINLNFKDTPTVEVEEDVIDVEFTTVEREHNEAD